MGPIPQKKAPQRPGNFPVCPKCNRQHPGQCLRGSGNCFKCGASDHMLKDCPQWMQPTQGRVTQGKCASSILVDLGRDFSTVLEARRLMHKGCQAFWANVVSAPDVTTPSLSDVPVVREFLDVFPDDITGLQPEREVEFAIDFLP
ncbi:uncharacterized protein [Primulina eburnea]|uniref:uncharacterized protein n=1 Tax=Primulina eburnea TaxID=1245227 RepID=UPI003C6BE3DF